MILKRELPCSPLSHTGLPLSYVCRRHISLRTPPTCYISRSTPPNTISHIPGTPGDVSVLFFRTTSFTKLDAQIDTEGRFIFLMGTWESHACVIINVYISSPSNLKVLQCLPRFLARHPQVSVYVLGDFNSTLDSSLGVHRKCCPQGPRSYTALAKYIAGLGMFDLWRCKFPLKAQFSYHSLTHSTLSRIDLALGNTLTHYYDPKISYLTRDLSDHSRVQLSLTFPTVKLPLHWKTNLFWIPLFRDTKHMQVQIQHFLLDNTHSAPPGVVWDTLKAFIREMCIK